MLSAGLPTACFPREMLGERVVEGACGVLRDAHTARVGRCHVDLDALGFHPAETVRADLCDVDQRVAGTLGQ